MPATATDSEAALLARLASSPGEVEVSQVLAVIDAHYAYTPTHFSIGDGDDRVDNPAGQNQVACRILAFARLHQLDTSRTLACFGHYYRDEVVADPQGTRHANIRAFMRHGWSGVHFHGDALQP
ncbi:MAG: HopJ type III effector protein [Alcanivorax sp.]|nr:HopJ type III effector protein [Alcanivorax sp.]